MIFITDKEMHGINNKLAIIIGNIDIGYIKGSLKDNVIKASKELQEILGVISHRNLKIKALLDPNMDKDES